MKKIISNEEYHAGPELSNSKISKLHKSIRDFLHPSAYESDSMDFGQAVHDCILQPDVFKSDYGILPEDHDGRKKEGKARMDEFFQLGLKPIKHEEWKACRSIRERLLKHSLTRNILEVTEKEIAYYSEFKKFGKVFPVKCKPDAHDDNIMLDIKTTRSFDSNEFKWAINRFGYHRQSAWYTDVFEASQVKRIENFLIVAIENKPPYNIGLRLLDQESTDLGRKQYLSALEKLSRFIDKKSAIIPTELKDVSSILKFMSDNVDLFDEELEINTTGLPQGAFYEAF